MIMQDIRSFDIHPLLLITMRTVEIGANFIRYVGRDMSLMCFDLLRSFLFGSDLLISAFVDLRLYLPMLWLP